MKQESPSSRANDTSEVFIGVCEMETDVWSCGNCSTLVGTHVNIAQGISEYRFVCVECARAFGANNETLLRILDDLGRFSEK